MSAAIDLSIAKILFRVSCRDKPILPDLDPAYRSFLRDRTENSTAETEIPIDVQVRQMPDTSGMTRLAQGGESWSLYRNGSHLFLSVGERAEGKPIWVARFSEDIEGVTVYCGDMFLRQRGEDTVVTTPVRYPMDQLLLIHVLSRRGGVLFHAAGLARSGRGYLFLGKSGAGKSTIARLLAGGPDREMISDDRIVVRKMNGTYVLFGTPWPGDAGYAVDRSLPLGGIFFIHHGGTNRISDVTRQEALERLLPVTSIPWHDRDATASTLDFCDGLIDGIPSYDFHFSPGKGVGPFLDKFLGMEQCTP